jgi:hypothetical protein
MLTIMSKKKTEHPRLDGEYCAAYQVDEDRGRARVPAEPKMAGNNTAIDHDAAAKSGADNRANGRAARSPQIL